jgi:hypothetical protein
MRDETKCNAMPYLLLALGILIGLYALYRFFVQADVAQVKSFFKTTAFTLLGLIILFFALTGRLPVALILLVFAVPFIWKHMRPRMKKPSAPSGSGPMTRAEALEILGLTEPVTEEALDEAYKRLMQKVHPDHQGSDWMAVKLNQARDLLQRP